MSVCGLRYPACNARAQYFHLWPARCTVFLSHYLVNGTNFEKKRLLNIIWVFWFPLQLWNSSHSKRNSARLIKNVYWSSCKVPVFRDSLNEAWIISTDFRKILEYQILYKSVHRESNWSMRTDRRTWTKLIVAFRMLWTRRKKAKK